MNSQTTSSKILSFFLVKMIIGIAVVVGSVFLVEWLGRLLLDQTQLTDNFKTIIIAIADAIAALLKSSYRSTKKPVRFLKTQMFGRFYLINNKPEGLILL